MIDDPQVVSVENEVEAQSFSTKFPFLKKRKTIIIFAIFMLCIIVIPLVILVMNQQNGKDSSESLPEATVIPDQLIVEYKDKYTKEQALALKDKLEKVGVISQEKLFNSNEPRLKNFYLLHFKKGTDVVEVKKDLNSFPEIESIDIQYKVVPFVTPNDPLYPQMWAPSKIDLPNAWSVTTGSRSVIVAVIDSGIDYTHPDLAGNVIKGPNLAKNSGRSSTDPGDDFGHGTHVAGTIGAVGNNNIGITGNSWNIGILGIKVGDARGVSDIGIISQGIVYASQQGAKVINISMGTDGAAACSSSIQNAIDQANANGSLVIVAAGNDNVDAGRISPGSCSGVMVIAATEQSDKRAPFSNYGSKISMAAPGVSILSTVPPGVETGPGCGDKTFGSSTDGYGYCNGTSMAAPEVSGVAGLLLSINPKLTASQVKKCLLDYADPITTDKPVGGKRLNAFNTLNACSGIAPISPLPTEITTITPVGNLTATPIPNTTVLPGGTLEVNVVYDVNKNSQPQDPTDLPYNGAAIDVTGPVSKTGATDTSGKFTMTGIAEGQYTIKVTIPGLDSPPATTSVPANGKKTLTVLVPALLLTPTVANQPTPTPIVGQPIVTEPATTKAPKPTPTPATTYSCHMKGSGLPSTGAITIGNLVCTPNK